MFLKTPAQLTALKDKLDPVRSGQAKHPAARYEVGSGFIHVSLEAQGTVQMFLTSTAASNL